MSDLTIKQFKGINRDGDSSDMPKETLRILNNWDIDKSTQKLVCRKPYYPYTDLNPANPVSNIRQDNTFPSFPFFELYKVIRYVTGVSDTRHNTMIIYRTSIPFSRGTFSGYNFTEDTTYTHQNKYGWKIIDNAPLGGDGNPFIVVSKNNTDQLAIGKYNPPWNPALDATVGGFEYGHHCDIAEVDGRLRIALGNADPYRIYMPHSVDNYFYNGNDYLVTDIEALCLNQNGFYFKVGSTDTAINGSSVTYSQGFVYLEGRLYPQYQEDNTLSGSVLEGYGKVLDKGKYDFIISPLFDSFPVQYGAPIAEKSFSILEEPTTETFQTSSGAVSQAPTTFLAGYTYRMEKEPFIFEEETVRVKPTQNVVYNAGVMAITSDKGNTIYGNIKDPYMASGRVVNVWTPPYTPTQIAALSVGDNIILNYNERDLVSSSVIQSGIITGAIVDVGGTATTKTWDQITIEFKYFIFRPAKTLEFRVKTADNVAHTVRNSPEFIFENAYLLELWDTSNPTNPSVYQDWNLQGEPVPYMVGMGGSAQSVVVHYSNNTYSDTNPTGLIIQSNGVFDRGITYTPNASWGVDYTQLRFLNGAIGVPIIKAFGYTKGQNILINFSFSLDAINPRLLGFNLYCRRTLEGFVEEADYRIVKFISVRDAESLWVETPNVTSRFALHATLFDSENINKTLGYWKVDYSTDGKGYRPYSHTLEDITRRMGLIEHRRDRMYAGLLDEDEGQELVGFTPISNGYSQLDVWFKPKILTRGNGQPYTALLEFNDNLLWFQKNNIVIGTMGDSNRMTDYQFYGTGGGVGTELVRTIAKSDRSVFFATYDGIYRLQGQTGENIALGAWSEDWNKIPLAEKEACFGAYNPKMDEYWLFVPGVYYSEGHVKNREPKIWIWDDNEINGNTWRTYTLDHLNDDTETYPNFDKSTPIYFFADEENNWIFVDSSNFSYFWRVNDIPLDVNRVNTIPLQPITLEVETQNLADRLLDMIPEAVQVTREMIVRTHTTVTVYRNEASSDYLATTDLEKQQEQVILRKEFIHRPRRITRRRSDSLRVGISFEDRLEDIYFFDGADVSLVGGIWRRPEIREISLRILPDLKRAK